MPAALIGEGLLSIKLLKANLAAKFTEEMAALDATAAAESKGFGAALAQGLKLALVGALAAVATLAGVGAVSVKMAADFNQAMEMVHTQAGATQAEVDTLKQKVLDLAGATGTAPDQLAASLYHVESAGFRGAEALSMVEMAAKLAKLGNADLEATTQAVVGSLAAFGDQGMTAAKAVAYLNAIVGTGDMRMTGLASAMSTGILPAARVFGLSMADVGAALATLTDNVTPPEEAATRLRMTFALLGAPTKAAAKALQSVGIGAEQAGAAVASRDRELAKYGITVNQLAADLHKPNGLLVAIGDLKSHLTAAGLNAQEQAAVISRAFGGGRSSAAIMTLLSEFDRFQSKYKDQAAGVAGFNESWAATQQQLNYQLDASKAKIEAALIPIGEKLTPYVIKLLPVLSNLASAGFGVLSAAVDRLPALIGLLAPKLDEAKTFFTGLIPVAQQFASSLGSVLVPMLKYVTDHTDLLVKVLEAIGIVALVAVGGIALIAAAIVGLVAGVDWLYESWKSMNEKGLGQIQNLVVGGVKFVRSFLAQLRATWNDITRTVEAGAAAIHDRPIYWLTRLALAGPAKLYELGTKAKTAWNVISGDAEAMGASLFRSVDHWFKQLPGDAQKWLQQVLTRLTNWAGNLLKEAGDAALGLVRTISDKIMKTDWGSVGRGILTGILNAVAGAISGAKALFSSVTRQITQGFKDALGIKSPSRVFAREVGMPIGEGIVTGLRSANLSAGTRPLLNQLLSMTDQVVSMAARGRGALVGLAAPVGSGGSPIGAAAGQQAQKQLIEDAFVNALRRSQTTGGASGLGKQEFNFYGDVKPNDGRNLGRDVAWQLKYSPR